MIKLLEKLLSIIYSYQCFYCNSTKEDKSLCSRCRRKINFMPSGVLKEINGCRIYACTLYEDVIKKLIIDLKYNKKKYLAKVMAELMYEYYERLNLKENFVVLSVPIHKNRLRERHYNHMDLVNKEFSKLANLRSNNKFLLRVKDTKKQFKLHKTERIKNIQGAFKINEKETLDRSTPLLILDDITSTGITIEEIVKLLRNNGYNKLTALILATPDIWN